MWVWWWWMMTSLKLAYIPTCTMTGRSIPTMIRAYKVSWLTAVDPPTWEPPQPMLICDHECSPIIVLPIPFYSIWLVHFEANYFLFGLSSNRASISWHKLGWGWCVESMRTQGIKLGPMDASIMEDHIYPSKLKWKQIIIEKIPIM
jgi:hypothetical protein